MVFYTSQLLSLNVILMKVSTNKFCSRKARVGWVSSDNDSVKCDTNTTTSDLIIYTVDHFSFRLLLLFRLTELLDYGLWHWTWKCLMYVLKVRNKKHHRWNLQKGWHGEAHAIISWALSVGMLMDMIL